MIIGLDRSFKPKWVYKILQMSKPGVEFKELEPEFFNIIEYEGLKSKRNVLTIIRRYYLQLEKKNRKDVFSNNYLHELSLKYSYKSLKPLLLFVLISKCPIVQFLQSKINRLFSDQEEIDTSILHKHTKKVYGDRKVVKYAVGYYLTILSYFNVLNKEKTKYYWENHKLTIPKHILKEMVIVYAYIHDQLEIDVLRLSDDIAFSVFDLTDLESVLMEYNTQNWIYQKRFDCRKIIIK